MGIKKGLKRNKEDVEPTRRSLRIQGKGKSLPNLHLQTVRKQVSPKSTGKHKHLLLNDIPIPLKVEKSEDLGTFVLPSRNEVSLINISSTDSEDNCKSPETVYESPSNGILLSNCSVCPAVYIQKKGGSIYQTHTPGGKQCLLSPSQFCYAPLRPRSAQTTIDITSSGDSIGDGNDEGSIANRRLMTVEMMEDRLSSTPRSSGRQLKRRRVLSGLDDNNATPSKLLKTMESVTLKNASENQKPVGRVKGKSLWSCGNCGQSFHSQQEYMYHSCGVLVPP